MSVEVRPLREEETGEAYDVVRRSFNSPKADEEKWVANLGPLERTRVVMAGGRIAAFSRLRPFGQFFGGCRVPLGGYSPVATAPEHRGRGYGSLVTVAHYEEMRARGEALAGLYPASTPLYRAVGFGLGGVWAEHEVPAERLRGLAAGGLGVTPRRATRDDLPAIYACYARAAPTVDGWLDRPEVWWRRILADPWDDRHVYVVDGDGGPGAGGSSLAGYVAYEHTEAPRWGYGLKVGDVVAERPDVAAALWALVGSSSTMAPFVVVKGPPEHPLLLLLPEQEVRQTEALRWMLRLVDAPGAVAARGYPAGLRVAVDLEITGDRHCPWNNGRWRLVVEDGCGRLEPGGGVTGADVRVEPPALASLWSGYSSASALAAAGLLAGAREAAVAALDAAFAGPTPWSLDFY